MSLNVVYLRLLGYYLTTENAVVKNITLIVEFCKISSLKLCSLTQLCGSPTHFIA